MRTIYRSNPAVYEHLFKNQVGHGLPVYIGRGGLGNILSGLFRSLVPVMKRGGKALLREGVRSAVGVGQDVLDGANLKTAVKRRATESGQRLVKKALVTTGFLPTRARPATAAARKPNKRGRRTVKRSQPPQDILS